MASGPRRFDTRRKRRNGQFAVGTAEDDSGMIAACKRLAEAARLAHMAEHDSGGANPKVLHAWEHAETMFEQAREIGQILGFSRRQHALVELIIAHHDLVLDVRLPPADQLNALVVRNRGVEQGVFDRSDKGSEGKSADALRVIMETENEHARSAGAADVFTQEEIETSVWATHATCPEAFFDKPFADFKSEDGTVDYYEIARRQNPALAELLDELAAHHPPIISGLLLAQSHLEGPLEQNQKVPLEVFAVANADIEGSSLAKTPEACFRQGDRECLELHHNWRDPRTFDRLMHGDAPDDVRDRDLLLNDAGRLPNFGALAWLDLQVGFAVWQALRAEKENYLLCTRADSVNKIPANQAAALREDFGHAVPNIRATIARAARVRKEIAALGEKEQFQYVAREMNFAEGLLW